MEEQIKFWIGEDWPIDAMGYTFLGRAIIRLGEAMYPETWTPFDGITFPARLPENVCVSDFGVIGTPDEATPTERLGIHRLLEQRRPDLGRAEERLATFGRIVPPFTEEEWLEGLGLAIEHDGAAREMKQRFSRVLSVLVTEFLSGRLTTVLRDLDGGRFTSPLDPHLWNSENLSPRFILCQMNPAAAFGPGVTGDGFQYIFVEKSGLESLLKLKWANGDGDIDAGTKQLPWQRIIQIRNENPGIRKEGIRAMMKMSKDGFMRHWQHAVEKMPELKTGGRPRKLATNEE